MRNRKRLAVFCLLCLAGASLAAVLFFSLGNTGNGWTVMVYMIGSDLESKHGLAGKDLEEMQASVRGDTSLLVMAGGAKVWNNGFDPEACCIYRVTQKEIQLLDAGCESMGSPVALERLLRMGLEKAKGPSALILWDHGYGALEGFGKDDCHEDSRLTMPELKEALEAALSEQKLTLLGFDACLMASAETALTVSPYADYMVASQETEPPEGWDYSFLQSLSPAADGEKAGNEIMAAFENYYRKQYDLYPDLWQPYTLCLIRLKDIHLVSSAVNDFLGELHGQMIRDGFSPISRVRSTACAYGRTTTTTEYDLIDLGSLARQFQEKNTNSNAVLEALDRCVQQNVGVVDDAHGLSIYFPQQAKESNRLKWRGQLDALPIGQQWKDFLTDFEIQLDSHRELRPLETAEGAYAVQLDDDLLQDFDRAKYFVLKETAEGEMVLLYAGNDYVLQDHTVTIPYHGQCLMLHTPEEDAILPAFYIQEDDHAAYYQSNVISIGNDDDSSIALPESMRLRIQYDKAGDTWHVFSAFQVGDHMVTGRQGFKLDDQSEVWAVYTFYQPTYNASQCLNPLSQWKTLDYLSFSPQPIRYGYSLSESPLPREDGSQYWLQVVVVDTYQTEYASPLFPLSSV